MNRRMALALLTSGLGFAFHGSSAASDERTHRRAFGPTSKLDRSEVSTASPRSDLSTLGSNRRVRSIRHTSGSYRVVTADGGVLDFLESDLRFKVDSSDAGPGRGSPVISVAGPVGDRAWVFFSAPEEISAFFIRDA
ncbi:MAG: hypothetical protein AB7Q76_01050 [Gammaproteobacteria bacterium]